MDFIAIDFETANNNQAPCAVGYVVIMNNDIKEEFYSLINPSQSFTPSCVAVHGITRKDVVNSPAFPDIWENINKYIRRLPVVAHNVSFDKAVIEKTIRRYKLPMLPIVYYDTMNLYRHNYPSADSFNLESVCGALNIPLNNHHNALADAKATAQIMINFLHNSDSDVYPSLLGENYDFSSQQNESDKSTWFSKPKENAELIEPLTDYDMVDEIVFLDSNFVLSGFITGYTENQIETLIEQHGGKLASGISRKINYLIVGLQDISMVKDKDNAKSGKLIKAESLRAEGVPIKIISADAFLKAIQN